MEWIKNNSIEIIGAFLALIYLFLEIKEKWTMWIVGIFSSCFYVFIFYHSRVYAQMGLNVYFLAVNFYGLYYWKFARASTEKQLEITHITLKKALILLLIASIFFVFIGKILALFTDSTVPYTDALLAALSIIATWMVARKILEHWYVWIFVNFYSIGMYYWLELYPTAILYAVYAIMSIVGLFQWRQSMQKISVL